MPRVAEVLERALPDAEAGPPAVEVGRAVPGAELGGDRAPLRAVLEPSDDGLDRLALVLHPPASGADGIEGGLESAPLLVRENGHRFGG